MPSHAYVRLPYNYGQPPRFPHMSLSLSRLDQVEDSAVLRFPQAVTHFSPGSYASRPLQTTSFTNVFMAGDWVKGVPHGANGLSQVSSCALLRCLFARPPCGPWSSSHALH